MVTINFLKLLGQYIRLEERMNDKDSDPTNGSSLGSEVESSRLRIDMVSDYLRYGKCGDFLGTQVIKNKSDFSKLTLFDGIIKSEFDVDIKSLSMSTQMSKLYDLKVITRDINTKQIIDFK